MKQCVYADVLEDWSVEASEELLLFVGLLKQILEWKLVPQLRRVLMHCTAALR